MKALKTKKFEDIRKDPLGKEALKHFASSDKETHEFILSTGKRYVITSTESEVFSNYNKNKDHKK